MMRLALFGLLLSACAPGGAPPAAAPHAGAHGKVLLVSLDGFGLAPPGPGVKQERRCGRYSGAWQTASML